MYCHKILEPSKYRYHLPHTAGNSVSHWIPSLSHLYNILNLSLYFLSLVDIECGEQNKYEELNPSKCQKNEKEKKVEATSTTLSKLVDSKRKKKKRQWRKQWKLLSNSSARLLRRILKGTYQLFTNKKFMLIPVLILCYFFIVL